jgi:hypothetical protein
MKEHRGWVLSQEPLWTREAALGFTQLERMAMGLQPGSGVRKIQPHGVRIDEIWGLVTGLHPA